MDNMKHLFRNINGLTEKFFGSLLLIQYDFWSELIHSLASLKRRELLNKISEYSDIIEDLSSSEAFREIANAIDNVGRWFP